jgi:hypothetical protein
MPKRFEWSPQDKERLAKLMDAEFGEVPAPAAPPMTLEQKLAANLLEGWVGGESHEQVMAHAADIVAQENQQVIDAAQADSEARHVAQSARLAEEYQAKLRQVAHIARNAESKSERKAAKKVLKQQQEWLAAKNKPAAPSKPAAMETAEGDE